MTRTDHPMTISYPVHGATNGTGRKGWIFAATQTFALWKQRRHLALLDDAALRDIGLSRREAMTEADKPLWDVPANWLR